MSMVSVNLEEALQRFGLNSFRPGQMDVISQIIAATTAFASCRRVGKSLCFQIPSVVRQGLTIVVSPLIALMKDQVDGLLKRGISATLINSSLSGSEQTQRLQQMAEGKFSLVYVAPERLLAIHDSWMRSVPPHPIVGDRRGSLHQRMGA